MGNERVDEAKNGVSMTVSGDRDTVLRYEVKNGAKRDGSMKDVTLRVMVLQRFDCLGTNGSDFD